MGDRRAARERIEPGVAWSFGATVVTRNPDELVRMGVPVLAFEADASV